MSEWFLVRAGETAPLTGGHGSWVETDHPAVVACMGSDPACAAEGCQLRRQAATLRAQVEALRCASEAMRILGRCRYCGSGTWKGLGVDPTQNAHQYLCLYCEKVTVLTLCDMQARAKESQ